VAGGAAAPPTRFDQAELLALAAYEGLEKKGLAEEETRALDGSQGFPWIL